MICLVIIWLLLNVFTIPRRIFRNVLIEHSEKHGVHNKSETTTLSILNQIPDLERRIQHKGKQNYSNEHRNKNAKDKTTKRYRGKNFHFIIYGHQSEENQ